MSQTGHWANISERGTTTGMRFLIGMYKIGGPNLFKIFMFPVISVYFLLKRDARHASRDYLNRIEKSCPELPAISWRLSFLHFWQFALCMIDKFAIWMGKITENQIQLHNVEIIDQLVEQNKGAIFAITHLGNFEIMNALAQRHQGIKLTILHHTKHTEKFNRVLKPYIENNAIQFLQVTDLDVSLAMQLSEKVDKGEFVAIAADRIPISNPEATIECDFLGSTAQFPTGIYVLASLLSVAIVMIVCIKEDENYNIYFETLSESQKIPRSKRNQYIAESSRKFAKRLEFYTKKSPLQWFNFYHFWGHDHQNK